MMGMESVVRCFSSRTALHYEDEEEKQERSCNRGILRLLVNVGNLLLKESANIIDRIVG